MASLAAVNGGRPDRPMLPKLNLILDLLIALAACLSAWFWWVASRQRVRRISRTEELDAGDMNRIVTALNRTQILNARAALFTALAALTAAARILLSALV